jgi:hypothetical protein
MGLSLYSGVPSGCHSVLRGTSGAKVAKETLAWVRATDVAVIDTPADGRFPNFQHLGGTTKARAVSDLSDQGTSWSAISSSASPIT